MFARVAEVPLQSWLCQPEGGDSFVHSANLICPDTSCSAFHGLYNASKVRRQ